MVFLLHCSDTDVQKYTRYMLNYIVYPIKYFSFYLPELVS
jgi:hypothetical protein